MPPPNFRNYDAMTLEHTLIELQNKLKLAWSKTVAITYFIFCPSLCFNVNPENSQYSVFLFRSPSLYSLILFQQARYLIFLLTWQKESCEGELPSAGEVWRSSSLTATNRFNLGEEVDGITWKGDVPRGVGMDC